jgi:hypothetical protein
MLKKVLVVVLSLGILVAGVSAQDGNRGRGDGDGRGRGGEMGQLFMEIMDTVQEATGLDRTELMQAVQGGQTIAELITANGGNVEEITQAVTNSITQTVNTMVTEGNLTQERADTILANLPARIEEALNSPAPIRDGFGRGEGGMGEHDGFGRGRGGMGLEVAAELTGLTTQELRTQLQSGTSLGEILTANNVTFEAYADAVIVPMQERLAQEVTDGRISQAIMDARLELARLEILFRLENPEAR